MFICTRFAVVLAILLVGMVGGFLYLRFVVGAKGYEQIPFYSHFVEFGNLQAVSIVGLLYIILCVNRVYRMVVT